MRTFLAFFASILFVANVANAQSINEIRISEPGTDLNNFFEIAGNAGDSLAGLSLITVGGEFNPGLIEFVYDLGSLAIPSDGFFLAHQTDAAADLVTGDDFFGSPTNFLLVDGFTGAVSDDIDTDDDGVIDGATPWTSVLDGILLVDDDGVDFAYGGSTTVGPAGTFTPAHVFRDADGTGNWQVGVFDDLSSDTPGASNTAAIPEPSSALLVLSVSGFALLRRKR